MGYLSAISEDQAAGKLADIYEEIKTVWKRKQVSPVLRAFSMKPEVLEAVIRLSTQVTFRGSSLARRWEEMVSTAISTWNRCHY